MKSKSVGTLLIAFGILMILAAALLVGYNLWDNIRADQSAQQVLLDLSVSPAQGPAGKSADIASPALPSEADDIPPHILNPDLAMPETLISGVAYIGILEIPDLNLVLPIASQWNPNTARTAPCRYAGSVYSNDMVVAGHNYQKHFGKLPSLPMGTLLRFIDIEGNAFFYEILECETVQATDIDGMCTGEWDLTLFTCTVGGHARFAIRCSLVEEQ